ncbi:MAG TPA: glycosyltransferase 87 family protein [Candidatus Limnocylindrales bacterium]|nr:glycosyltransferase 87 family protein [Candidatus Limnocylindrales bacterium]
MTSETQTEKLKLAGLLAAGALLEALYVRMHSLYYLKNHAIAFIVLALGAGIVYLIALYGFDQTRASRASFILLIFCALVFRATLWPMQPTLSDDLQRYRWDAKVQANGFNPYAIAPRDPRLAYLRDHEYKIMPGRETPTIYPPATELVYRATWKVFPGPTAFKAPFAAADVLVIVLLAWIFRGEKDRTFRVAVYAWNPLVIVEFAGSGHNDVLAILGIVCGLALFKKCPALASSSIALAAMAKVFPAVLLPVWIRRAGWPEKRSGWWAAGLAAASGALVLLPYWSAIGAFRANLAYYEATWKNYHASLYTVIDWLSGGGTRIPALAGAAAIWGLALWLAWKRAEPARAAYLLIGTSLAFWPNGYPWYFTWIVPLLCFFPNPAWLLLTVLQFLSYNVLIGYGILGQFKFDPVMQWLVYAPFYALLIGQYLARRIRSES